jgi:hypothetical protein
MARSPMVAAQIHLDEALRHRGCPLCYLGSLDVLRYLWYLLYEYVTSPATHDRLERSWGFCHEHAWLVQEMNWRQDQDGTSTANLCEWQIDRFRTILQRHLVRYRPSTTASRLFRRRIQKPRLAQAVLADLAPVEECPACVVRHGSEQATIRTLVELLRDRQELRALYQQSFGLCFPHFKTFLEAAQAEEEVLAFIIAVQSDKLTQLSSELGEYLRKHDYRFSHEPYGEERDSFIRATEILVGAKRGAALLSQRPTQRSAPSSPGMENADGGQRSGSGEPSQRPS